MTIKHAFTPLLQPTNNSCTQTATAMLLSHYDLDVSLDQLIENAPVQLSDDGNEAGSSMQQLAIYCIDQDYNVELFSFDSLILDLSWQDLPNEQLIGKLEAIKDVRNVASLGGRFTRQYIEEYISFLQKGGALVIKPYPTTELIKELLAEGPICVAVNHTTMQGTGHTKNIGLREDVQDDTENDVSTHVILVYGIDENDNFLVSDPWGAPQENVLAPDQLIASIMAAQWLCDNLLFRIRRDVANN